MSAPIASMSAPIASMSLDKQLAKLCTQSSDIRQPTHNKCVILSTNINVDIMQ